MHKVWQYIETDGLELGRNKAEQLLKKYCREFSIVKKVATNRCEDQLRINNLVNCNFNTHHPSPITHHPSPSQFWDSNIAAKQLSELWQTPIALVQEQVVLVLSLVLWFLLSCCYQC